MLKNGSSFDETKRRKMVGSFVKIAIRSACALQLIWLVLPYVDFAEGLFHKFNIREHSIAMRKEHRLSTCA